MTLLAEVMIDLAFSVQAAKSCLYICNFTEIFLQVWLFGQLHQVKSDYAVLRSKTSEKLSQFLVFLV